MKQLVCDIDDVLLDLVQEWIRRYNFDFQENIKKSDITDWDLSQFIQNKNNKEYLYQYIEDPSIYDNIKPIKNSLWGINQLRKLGYRVLFVTSATKGHHLRKLQWLQDYNFIDHRKNYFEAVDKSVYIGEYIIDDKFDNVINFQGKGILYQQSWNIKENWNRKCNGWKEVINLISLEQS